LAFDTNASATNTTVIE